MDVFWEQGYDGASMETVLAATGLSRSSLYETFGDKRGLFLRTVSAYASRSAERRRNAFNSPDGLIAGLTDYLGARVETLTETGHPAGCYLTSISATLKSDDAELRSFVEVATAEAERDIRRGFGRALESRAISDRTGAAEWTALFLALSWGLNVASRMGRDRQVMLDMVNAFLELLTP